MLGQTGRSTPEAPFGKFLHDQRQERDEEDDGDGDNAAGDPILDGLQVGTSVGSERIGDEKVLVEVADDGLVPQGAEIDEDKHEELDRQDDDQVVNVEAGMGVVEGQEAVERELGSEVVVFSREHLLAHAGTDLCGEVEDGAETKVTTFTTLVVFAVLYPSAA